MAGEDTFEFEILPGAQEGGGGGGTSDGGSNPAATAAPGADRTAALEARIDRLTSSMDGYISTQEGRQKETEKSQFENAVRVATERAETAVVQAERALAAAYDEGEGVAIASAQRKLSEATAKRERISAEIDAQKRNRADAAKQSDPSTKQLDTTNLDNWKSRNAAWYGIDAEMTRKAHEIDRQIQTVGVLTTGTPEYYAAIDKQMSALYSDRLGGAPSTTTTTPGAGGSPAHDNKVRFTRPQIDAWNRMGIDTSDPETLKRMAGHRKGLADRGILAPEPVRGSVR